MKAIWVFLILVVAACSAGEVPHDDEACVDPSKKDPNGVCTMEYKPVCGCNGTTYGNACAAKKDGVLRWTEGPCDCIDESKIPKGPTACTEQYAPVCGCNGVTYANSCFAGIAGVISWTEGACACIDESKISQGPCTLEYAPVCGCNNVTYGNTCEAQRAGVTSWTAGACPK